MKRRVRMIVAMDENGVIGTSDGKLPWSDRAEMNHFRKMTLGSVVIMGRKTWESLPPESRPLLYRLNIIVTRDQNQECFAKIPGKPFLLADSLEDAIDQAQIVTHKGNVFIIGGAQLYREALEKDLVDSIHVSRMKNEAMIENPVLFPVDLIESWECMVDNDYETFESVQYFRPNK